MLIVVKNVDKVEKVENKSRAKVNILINSLAFVYVM